MKKITFLLMVLISSICSAQNTDYQSLKLGFYGVYDRSADVITDELALKAEETLGIPDMTKYEFIANNSKDYILVGLVPKGSKWDKAQVVFQNEKIVQVKYSKDLIDPEVIQKLRAEAIENGLEKDEVDFGVFKFIQGNVVWYELGGTITGEFGHMILDANGKFVSKDQFDH